MVRETQRAATRGTAVQLSQRQYPELYRTAMGLLHADVKNAETRV